MFFNKHLILFLFIFFIPSIAMALPKCGEKLHNCTGTYIWPSGNQYKGDWKNNRQHGFGVALYPRGDKYVGYWKNGKMDGEGIFTLKDGSVLEGVWKENKFLYAKKIISK